MHHTLVILLFVLYFGVLILISVFTSKDANTTTFFTANRQSPWYLVAFGMIGTTLSGISYISVPGNVGKIGFAYLQIVLGYFVGYLIIMWVLLPLYYKMNVVSIYTYLEKRFDVWAYKTGSLCFLISRTLSSSLRLFLAATVLQFFIFDAWGVPFFVTVSVTIALIWVYTYKGGIKTIVWTDTFQTFFLIVAVAFTAWKISDTLNLDFGSLHRAITQAGYMNIFHFDDPNAVLFFPKQFLAGIFITIAMTGMDQDIMQKNLSCKNLKEAQKNMFWFSVILIAVNVLFLLLGALLYLYASAKQLTLPATSDELFPLIAFTELGPWVAAVFLLGITASSYASADSALAGLTTAFCFDFLNFKNKEEQTKANQKLWVHVGFSILFLIVIFVFKGLNKISLIDVFLQVAAYTYGPLLGLFSFGLLTQRQAGGPGVLIVNALAPVLCFLFYKFAPLFLGGYKVGPEIIVLNGLLSFLGLWLIAKPQLRYN